MNVVCYEGGLLWTWSVMNVVCYERGLLWTWSVMNWSVLNVVCNELVCYEHGLLWTWSVMNWSVCYERGLFWMVCFERSVMSRSVLNGHRHIQPITKKDLDLCQKHVILFRHNGTGIQRSRCMQHATAHHAFRAAMKLAAYVDRAGTTNLMFSKILSFDCLTNSKLKWIWFCSEGNSDDLLFVVHLKIFWLLL